jgi:hypothetical protein
MSEHETDPGMKGMNFYQPDEGDIRFDSKGIEMMKFCPDGKVYVRGEQVDDNQEIYKTFLTWMRAAGAFERFSGNTKPLIIEIHDPRNIVILDGVQQLGCISALKFEAAIDKIPPILEVEVPNVMDEMSQDLKDSIATTIEAVQRHGGQVVFRSPSEFEMDTDEQEQSQAEETIKASFLTPNQ